MRIHKWGFLLSYALYLLFAIIFTVKNINISIINTMVSAITITSMFFSISDLLYTKIDIDKKERVEQFCLYILLHYQVKIEKKKIVNKYGEKANTLICKLQKTLGDNLFEKLINEDSLTDEEKVSIINKVKESANPELIELTNNFLNGDEIENEIESSDEVKKVLECWNYSSQREREFYLCASAVACIGLLALLIILTLRIEIPAYFNNLATEVAFFLIIVNLLFKEYYKVKSVSQLSTEISKEINEIKEELNS